MMENKMRVDVSMGLVEIGVASKSKAKYLYTFMRYRTCATNFPCS